MAEDVMGRFKEVFLMSGGDGPRDPRYGLLEIVARPARAKCLGPRRESGEAQDPSQ